MKTQNPTQRGWSRLGLACLLAAITLIAVLQFSSPTPYGPILDYNKTESMSPRTTGTLRNDSKGSITTLRFNSTQPNKNWKGYVGNITGKIVLADSDNYSIFRWEMTTLAGEVFATRRSGSVNWANIVCADATRVAAEETAMGHTASAIDSISNTFNRTTHPAFKVGTKSFNANDCNYVQHTYVNDNYQTTDFAEVLLSDGTYVVYTTLLEDSTTGYDGRKYDFQMIVAENSGVEQNQAYYFYVELG